MLKVQQIMLLGLSGLFVLSAAGCSVLKQDIPVSSNPMGAKIYANGQMVGTTPMTVPLERNRSHVLTIVKDNYRQEVFAIVNRYQKDKVYMNAIQSGINSGLFFKNPSMGVGSSMSYLSAQKSSGEAYILYPPAVTVDLVPLSGLPLPSGGQSTSLHSSGPIQRSSQQPQTYNMQAPPMDRAQMGKELFKTGAGAAASQIRPIEKKISTSSSRQDYVTSDGTRVEKKSSSSVGVGINQAGCTDIIDLLF